MARKKKESSVIKSDIQNEGLIIDPVEYGLSAEQVKVIMLFSQGKRVNQIVKETGLSEACLRTWQIDPNFQMASNEVARALWGAGVLQATVNMEKLVGSLVDIAVSPNTGAQTKIKAAEAVFNFTQDYFKHRDECEVKKLSDELYELEKMISKSQLK